MPFAGETLPLSMQLHDGASGYFVIAILKDQDGNAVSGPYVDLFHIGNGKYTSDAVTMPSVGITYIEVTYEVYQDALLTLVSDKHFSGSDVFRFEIPDQVIVDKLDEIIAKLEGTLGSLTAVSATIEVEAIESVIETAKEIKAELTGDSITQVVDAPEEITSVIDAPELTATVECCEG